MEEMNLNFIKVDWNKFGEFVDRLYQNLKKYLDENNVKIDAIVPILREGGFTGLALAYKLNTWKVIPAHYKYRLYDGGYELEKKAELPKILYDLPNNPVFLLVDTWPCEGTTSIAVAKDLKSSFPNCKIISANLFCDTDHFPINHEIFEKVIFGLHMDMFGKYSKEEASKLGIDTNMYLFPWQSEQEESAGPLQKEYKYN